MNTIERFLSGEMPAGKFVKLLKTDSVTQAEIQTVFPKEAADNPSHPFWCHSKTTIEVFREYHFDLLCLISRICRFNGSLGDYYNLFATIQDVYSFSDPSFPFTEYYKKAFRLSITAVPDYIDGPEVQSLIEDIVRSAISEKNKSKQVRMIKDKLRNCFHTEDGKRPYWIQPGEWPMGQNSPMKYLSSRKTEDGKVFVFGDVDTKEQREITQYY